ncbi:MAG: hypothetical protein ACI4VU_08190 [Methanobrevibacter sp.]
MSNIRTSIGITTTNAGIICQKSMVYNLSMSSRIWFDRFLLKRCRIVVSIWYSSSSIFLLSLTIVILSIF